jgi:hypothetical protein
MAPDAAPFPVEAPLVPAPTPAEEFQQRIDRAEEMARGMSSPNAGLLPPAAPAPSIQPSAPLIMSAPSVQPSAPPIMAAPAPTNAEGAPLFDPEFMAKMASLGQALGPNPLFIGTNFGGMPTEQSLNLLRDPATGLMVNKSRTVELDDTGRVVREITPEGSVPGVYFTDSRGISATKGLGKGARFTPLDPNAVYTVVNQRTGEVVSKGVGAEGMKAAQLASMQLSSAGGRKADWAVVKADPSTGTSSTVANVDPRQSPLGKLADVALPVAGAFVAGPLGAAAGSGLSSVAQGRSLKDTLMRAGLSGAGAAGGAALGKAVGTAVGKAASQKLAQTGAEAATQKLAQTGAEAVGNIIVPGFKSALTGATVGSLLGGGASGALSSMIPGKGADFADRVFQQPTTSEGNPIVVSGSRIPASNIVTGALPGFGAGLPAVMPETIGDPIDVVERRPVKGEFDAAFPVVPDVGAITSPETEIVVRPQQPAKTTFDAAPVAPILPDLTKTPVDVVGPEKSILDKLKENLGVTDYMRLAALGLGLVGGGGGGNRGALSTIPGGLFGGSGVFGARLPAATLPGASTGFAPRTAAELRPKTTQDWYRYGYGPEQSFFSYVPKGEENKSEAFTGYAQGGLSMSDDSYAVNGPGTGRSDEIPALLSDGEYVIDAETVALLGDGSSKAGAERLDQLRVKIRKDKGRKLAKGEFSVNAKRPEHYLKGGRA